MDDIVISEKKLEDIIFDHLIGKNPVESLNYTIGRSSNVFKVYRQFNIYPYGIMDIIVFWKPDEKGKILFDIIELKKDIIDKDALIQILRYKKGFDVYLENNKAVGIELRTMRLIGNGISRENTFEIAHQAIDKLKIQRYDIGGNGITLSYSSHFSYPPEVHSAKLKGILLCADYAHHDMKCHVLNSTKKRG